MSLSPNLAAYRHALIFNTSCTNFGNPGHPSSAKHAFYIILIISIEWPSIFTLYVTNYPPINLQITPIDCKAGITFSNVALLYRIGMSVYSRYPNLIKGLRASMPVKIGKLQGSGLLVQMASKCSRFNRS